MDIRTTIASEINEHHAIAQAKAGEAIHHAQEAGRLLLEVKAALPHGEFGKWLEQNITVSVRQAQRYIAVAEGKQVPIRALTSKYDTVSHLPPFKELPLSEIRTDIQDDLLQQMQETQEENLQLQERVALMAKDDKDAEIDKLLTRIAGLDGRLKQQAMQIKTSSDGEKYHASVIHKLRKLLGVESHKEIVDAVAALRGI